jgi:hypothetical protein
MSMFSRLTHLSFVAIVLALFAAPRVSADLVQLANGDILHGKVLALDDKNLRLESDVHGKLSIPRGKIASITFGDRPAPAVAAPPAAGAAPALPAAPGSLDDILKQLKAGGGAGANVGDIQKLMPLLANPDALGFFQDKLRGLQEGSLGIQDIRKEAIRAREMVKDLKLGPEGDQALAPYLGILDRFIREADPARANPAQPPNAPAKK